MKTIEIFNLTLACLAITLIHIAAIEKAPAVTVACLMISALVFFTLLRSQELGICVLLLSVLTGGWISSGTQTQNVHFTAAFICAGIAASSLKYLKRKKQRRITPAGWLLAAFSLLAVFSGIFAFLRFYSFHPYPGLGYLDIAVNVFGISSNRVILNILFSTVNYFSYAGVFILATNIKWNREWAGKLRTTLLAAFTINALAVITQLLVVPGAFTAGGILLDGRATGFMNNCNALSNSSAVVLAFLPFLFPKHQKNTSTSWLLMIMLILCLYFGGGRSAMLFVILTYFCYGIYIFKSRKSERQKLFSISSVLLAATVSITLVLLFVMFPIGAERLSPAISDLSIDYFTFLRLGMWQHAGGIITSHPLGGIGSGTFFSEVGNFSALAGYPHWQTDNALNFYLHIGAELGIIALALLITAFIFIIRQALDQPARNQEENFPLTLALIPTILFLLVSLLGPHLIDNEVMLLFWLFVGVLTNPGASEQSQEKQPTTVKKKMVAAWAVLFVVAVSGMAWSSLELHPLKQWNKLRWHMEGGFFPPENEDGTQQWSSPRAIKTVRPDAGFLHIHWRIGHEEVAAYKPRVKIIFEDQVLLDKVVADPHWRHSFFFVRSDHITPQRLVFLVEPPLIPDKFLADGDKRRLGIRIGKLEFLDELPADRIGFWESEASKLGTFRWSKEEAYQKVPLRKGKLKLTIRTNHPDVKEDPVKVNYELNGCLKETITLNNHDWHEVVIDPSELPEWALPDWHPSLLEEVTGILRFQISRTWVPAEEIGSDDDRELGIAVSEVHILGLER